MYDLNFGRFLAKIEILYLNILNWPVKTGFCRLLVKVCNSWVLLKIGRSIDLNFLFFEVNLSNAYSLGIMLMKETT